VTYVSFLGVFLVPPLLLGIARVWRVWRWRHTLFLIGLSLVVLAWTSPWDNAAVSMGLWGFDPERISGAIIGVLPLEEYCFFLLQTWVTVVFLVRRLLR
jgi:lycopene cyclase domain-containing protein